MKKKILKSIKKSLSKQFEKDIKESVLSELYNGESKKDIKKLKKKLLKEFQEDIFGKIESEIVLAEVKQEPENVDTPPVQEKGKIIEYRGFKFDVDKMSQIVTGKKPKKNNDELPAPNVISLSSDNKSEELAEKAREMIKTRVSLPYSPNLNNSFDRSFDINSFLNKQDPSQTGFQSIDSLLDKKRYELGIPATLAYKKEEIIFFLDKLENKISNMPPEAKNLSYRHKKDDIYRFSYSKPGKDPIPYQADDFAINFDIELNVKNKSTKINTFSFFVEGFNFDKKMFELLDIVRVLDWIGFNMNHYINEINGVNNSDLVVKESVENINEPKSLKSNTKLEKFIDDKKIINILNSNDIANYGQLKNISDLTSLNGVGARTSERIRGYIDLANRLN